VIRTNGGPTAVCSKLEWLLSGTVSSDASSHLVSSHLALCQGGTIFSPPLKTVLELFWETETIGIKEPSDTESIDDSFFRDIQFVDNRYEVRIEIDGKFPIILTYAEID